MNLVISGIQTQTFRILIISFIILRYISHWEKYIDSHSAKTVHLSDFKLHRWLKGMKWNTNKGFVVMALFCWNIGLNQRRKYWSTLFWSTWHQIEFNLLSNQSGKCNYNPNLVAFNKIQKLFYVAANMKFCVILNQMESDLFTIYSPVQSCINDVIIIFIKLFGISFS